MATQSPETKAPETHAFQAEVSQLLNIVIHSLYTDREIFLRELISNAADALEKARHETVIGADVLDKDAPLAIRITADKEAGTVTISDSGIGMTREELVRNLGTIAHSGTRQFLAEAAKTQKPDVSLIGQFGVGFYSAFMVADRVTVDSRSLKADAPAARWESDGTGSYTLSDSDRTERGTTIVLHLKEDAKEFAEGHTLKDIVRRFSSFVTFPIEIDGEKVNTVQALWARSRSDIKDEEYTEFYKFIANAWDEPRYRLHFSADAPLSINALLFVPKTNPEAMGFGRAEPGVDLYCRRVLIQKHPEKLLPEWMRFVKGVIDSDDLPLNISRETMQDSTLVRKLAKVIVGRFLKFLNEEANKDAAAYQEFFESFGRFIKEGVTSDYEHKDGLAKLLRFESSKTEAGKVASLADYVSRLKDGQEEIYYINGPSRAAIESGPYAESLIAQGYEVIYNFDQIDDFVFDHLREFEGKKLVSADSADLKVPDAEKKEGELEGEELDKLCGWIKSLLGERIGSVKGSKRLVSNPAAIVTDGMTATMQRLMATLQKSSELGARGMTLEVNPSHPLLRKLADLRNVDEDFAKQLTEQLFDNALLAAGLMSDPRAMVERLNKMLSKAAGV